MAPLKNHLTLFARIHRHIPLGVVGFALLLLGICTLPAETQKT